MIHHAGELSIEVEEDHEYGPVVMVGGEVDAHTAPRLVDALDRALHQHPPRVLVDLSEVSFMGSAGVSALSVAHGAAEPYTLFVVVATGAALLPLQLSGRDSVFAVYPHRSMAQVCTAAALAPA